MAASDSANGRVHLFDELRGLSILLMVLYHAVFDLVALYNINIPIFQAPFIQKFLQPFFAGVFVMISGAVCHYSRNNLRRGGLALGVGLLLTLVTTIGSWFAPFVPDLFGILHMLGCSMILFALLQPLLSGIRPWIGVAVFGFLFAITLNFQSGLIGIGSLSAPLPAVWYTTGFLFPLGLPGNTFASADYFPLIPWFFLFLAGSFVGVQAKDGRLPRWFYRRHLPVLSVVGKHTLLIYILHQPALITLFSIICWLVTGSLFPA